MGATSGIGYEVAKLLAQRGWRVGVAGRRETVLSQMVAETEGIIAYEVIDVTSPQAVHGLHRLIDKLGGMDMYFHCSGIGYQNTDLDADKELPGHGQTGGRSLQVFRVAPGNQRCDSCHQFHCKDKRPGSRTGLFRLQAVYEPLS